MADLNKIVEDIEKLTVVEVSELVKMLEEKFGVSAAAPVMMAGAAAPAAEAAAKTEADVVIKDVGDAKIQVIRVVKDITGLGISEAKALVEGNGVIKEKCPIKEAEEIADKLKAVGCVVELK